MMEQRIEKAVKDRLGAYRLTVGVSRVDSEIPTVFVEMEYPIHMEVTFVCGLVDDALYVDSFTARCDTPYAFPMKGGVGSKVMNDWRAIWTALNGLEIK